MDDWDRPSGRPLREIPREFDSHAFLLKALHEAGNELEGAFYNLRPRQLQQRLGDEWSLIEIAAHLRDNEELALDYLRAILSSRRPVLPVVDLQGLVEERDYRRLRLGETLYELSELRQHVLHLLYNLSARQWQRAGEHPYRGSVSVAQVAKELNEHDLDHLWQVTRLRESLG